MADGVYAAMHRMQPSVLQPVAERAPAEAERGELPSGDHAMLSLGERGDQPIDSPRL